jgi:hypothetical protein
MKRFKKYIKDSDWFGHPVALNFNNHGSTHNTLFGGVFSIVFKLFLGAYLTYKTRAMIMLEDPHISTERQIVDVTEVG